MSLDAKRWIVAGLGFLLLLSLLLVAYIETQKKMVEGRKLAVLTADSRACVDCHKHDSNALVKEWEYSRHAQVGIGCVECHEAERDDIDAWKHEGVYISALVTPLDCAECHEKEYKEFAYSKHARAGEILASIEDSERDKIRMIGNIADTVTSCKQCHGSIIKFERDEKGQIYRTGPQKKPFIDPETWPNSGMGRLNPDGSKGSCHACHTRHAFQAQLSRSPETCGKCHMGKSHPQIDIYNESKHGIAFYVNRERMNLDKRGTWVLGRDYSAAPTCATCHISPYKTAQGFVEKGSHSVGERISWDLRSVISEQLNMVIYEDGYMEEYPDSIDTPSIGDEVVTIEKVLKNDKLINKEVVRTVEDIVSWDDRREKMIGVCLNCHNDTYVDNFYDQFDNLVEIYNENFAEPANNLMMNLTQDGVISPEAPWEKEVQWIFWELWNHEGRLARHGASMMGPSITRQGMEDLSRNFYTKFLPAVIDAAADKSKEMKKKYEKLVAEELSQKKHYWFNRPSIYEK
jgi:hypothetical protein